MSSLLHSFLGR